MKTIKCAIYTRKSTDEGLDKEFNTLDAQRESGENYVKSQQHQGWEIIPEHYDDGGYSGGSLQRPALQRLLQDVEDGKVNMIVVYKIDRLTRSLTDFAKLVDVFDRNQCSFVSVTQNFNTYDSMGRLMLNVLLSFAQFEREVITERIRDKVAASKKKGMWMGGYVPLGYGIANKKLIINHSEAKIVRLAFEQYLIFRSEVAVADWLNKNGYACKGSGLISKEQYLARILNNALYSLARESKNLGLDIKTQITLNTYGHIETVIVAIPMLEPENLTFFIVKTLGAMPDNLIVNGTGAFKTHSSVADCGVSGRKLACDFYGAASPIGGGSPWTKDGSKADVTLNIYARRLALQYLEDNDECFVYLSSCIGQAKLPSATVKTLKDGSITTTTIEINKKPFELVEELDLNKPRFAKLCRNGFI